MHAVKHQIQRNTSESRWSEAREARTRAKRPNKKKEGKCEENNNAANEPLVFICAQCSRSNKTGDEQGWDEQM